MALGNILSGLLPTAGSYAGGLLGGALGGSVVPGIGNAIGSGIGSVAGNYGGGLLSNYFSGGSDSKNSQQQPVNGMNPDFYNQLQSVQSNYLRQLQQQPQFQPTNINNILQGTEQKFFGEILPKIKEQFSGVGGQRSSGFANALGNAGSGLAQKLAELQENHARDQQSQMMQHRGQNLQQMGMLGNYLTGQSQLGQNQRQFEAERKNTSPYWLNPAINAIGTGVNAWSGAQNRAQQSDQMKQNLLSNTQNAGLGRQFDVMNHAAKNGILSPELFTGLIKTYMGLN